MPNEEKYNISGPITKKCDGKQIPESEPVVLFRAQDRLLPSLLVHYIYLCGRSGCAPTHVNQISDLIDVVVDWQHKNIKTVKTPDTDCTNPVHHDLVIADELKKMEEAKKLECNLPDGHWILAKKDDHHVIDWFSGGILTGDSGDSLRLPHENGWDEVGELRPGSRLSNHDKIPLYTRYDSNNGLMLIIKKKLENLENG